MTIKKIVIGGIVTAAALFATLSFANPGGHRPSQASVIQVHYQPMGHQIGVRFYPPIPPRRMMMRHHYHPHMVMRPRYVPHGHYGRR